MQTKLYSEKDFISSIADRKCDMKSVDLVTKYKILDLSLRRLITMAKEGNGKKKSGPPPILVNELEKDFRDWVIGIQRKGLTLRVKFPSARQSECTILLTDRCVTPLGRSFAHIATEFSYDFPKINKFIMTRLGLEESRSISLTFLLHHSPSSI
uniref:AlNc14C87G5550 protein n=1 Tax=Albugo laibachii Nc14 TaxID=890382 RepID=F0WG18_9STRA|nr:AlNc14C87G5550 [Albugo laibachii Nc14]|eukprot:CCA20152.1 AlNc14C87G5550 [Albugo laibachii Nc14]